MSYVREQKRSFLAASIKMWFPLCLVYRDKREVGQSTQNYKSTLWKYSIFVWQGQRVLRSYSMEIWEKLQNRKYIVRLGGSWLNLAPGKLRQKDCKFKAGLYYIVRPCLRKEKSVIYGFIGYHFNSRARNVNLVYIAYLYPCSQFCVPFRFQCLFHMTKPIKICVY